MASTHKNNNQNSDKIIESNQLYQEKQEKEIKKWRDFALEIA